MYICNRFFLCMTILERKKAVFYKDSLWFLLINLLTLEERPPCERTAFFFFNTQLLLYVLYLGFLINFVMELL